MKKSLLCMLAIAVCLSALGFSACNVKTYEGEYITDADITAGKTVINDKGFVQAGGVGRVVILRGVNLGGWLLQESWMCPVSGEDNEWANLDTIAAFEQRGFTDSQIAALFQSYQDNWITEADFDIISRMGCNTVRIPFWYRNFMTDECGTWITEDFDLNPGFQRLDWAIEQAAERDMYVILDMHGVPGGQSFNHSTGGIGTNKIYTDSACQDAMEKLWVAIASRYKDSTAVAAYDIMNEPHNNSSEFADRPEYKDIWSEESHNQYNGIYDRMIKAIRKADDNHMITVEGIWRVENLPLPAEKGWSNMMYQLHLYDDTKQFKTLVRDLHKYAAKYDVAPYIGEFSNIDGFGICENYGIGWTSWTYKGAKAGQGNWFMYWKDLPVADVIHDSYEEILLKWGECLKTSGFNENRILTDAVKKAAA